MLKIAVALMSQAGKVVVMLLCGTTWADYMPTGQLFSRKKKEARSLTAEEYMHVLVSIVKQLPKAAVRAGSLILVHDCGPGKQGT